MSFSFSIPSKSQSNRVKKPAASFSVADHPVTTSDPVASSNKKYVREFNPAEAPPATESKIKPIAPIPNEWRPTKKLKNLPNLPSISQPNGSDISLQFELDTGSNPEASDNSMAYGLNLRYSANGGASKTDRGETISEMELRKLREDLEKLPDDTGMDEFTDVPVEGFGAALLSGYGWKEGNGIGRNAKEDVKVCKVTKKTGRGGLGFSGDLPDNQIENFGGNKRGDGKEKKGFVIGKEVRIVSGRNTGMKGKVIQVKSDEDILVLRLSRRSEEKIKVQFKDVAELGSAEEEKCLRKLKIKEKNGDKIERRDSNDSRVNWLMNHIRIRIISKDLKGGRLFLKKGVVVDVVGPGLCDVSMDDSRELIQGVDQKFLETALPKRGGPVLVLCGRHKGAFGSLVERDSEKETAMVRDADTHEIFKLSLEHIAEYTGDPTDMGY